jgi:hypothetical protein
MFNVLTVASERGYRCRQVRRIGKVKQRLVVQIGLVGKGIDGKSCCGRRCWRGSSRRGGFGRKRGDQAGKLIALIESGTQCS